jgi:sugar (pentulose or hexulose) kinase
VGAGVVVAGVVAAGVVAAGVAPVSVGSVGVLFGVPPPSQAPKTAAKLSITVKPKIFVFITPLSPIVAI